MAASAFPPNDRRDVASDETTARVGLIVYLLILVLMLLAFVVITAHDTGLPAVSVADLVARLVR